MTPVLNNELLKKEESFSTVKDLQAPSVENFVGEIAGTCDCLGPECTVVKERGECQ